MSWRTFLTAGHSTLEQRSVVEFFGVVFVPAGNFDDDVGGAVGDGLATEARLWRDAGGFVEFVEFGVGGFVAGFEAFTHNDVAGGRRPNPPPAGGGAGFRAFRVAGHGPRAACW